MIYALISTLLQFYERRAAISRDQLKPAVKINQPMPVKTVSDKYTTDSHDQFVRSVVEKSLISNGITPSWLTKKEPDISYCTYCQTKLSPDSMRCANCGASVKKS